MSALTAICLFFSVICGAFPVDDDQNAWSERDISRRLEVRAVRLIEPLRVDGRLDDAVYTTAQPLSDFVQIEPREGSPATEKTELWLLFDQTSVYVSVRCWETEPDRVVAREMRRDSSNIWRGDDVVAFIFDTFLDRRNGVQFTVNALGGQLDGQVTNETEWNGDWNPVWKVEVESFEGGWAIEASIPFASLRYRAGRDQIWGFNAYRTNRWKNEISFLTPMPRAMGQRALLQTSLAATVVGLEVPAGSKNLEVKPYAIADLASQRTTDRNAGFSGRGGLDVRHRITQNLTADLTVNTDFAQVEADEQQANLTRFSLFFPEKREFFLENQGLFSFGGVTAAGQMAGASDAPILFYSRRIGLQHDRIVPLDAGGRLTGRAGRYSLGLLNIQADEEPVSGTLSTNFSVLRLKRDLLRKSSIGLMATRRSIRQEGHGSNQAFGVDATFGFFDNLAINAFWARTRSDGSSGNDSSYRAQFDYTGDRYGVQLERLSVGDQFNPEIGFVRRHDMRRTSGLLRFSPRPRSSRTIRKVSSQGSFAYIENGAGAVELKDLDGEFAIEFQNTDRLSVTVSDTYEVVPRAFRLTSNVAVPAGEYEYRSVRVGYNPARQRRVHADVSLDHGSFYSGHKTTVTVSQGRLNLSPRISAEPSYALNRVDLLEGSFTSHVGGVRLTYAMTPRAFVSALFQNNTVTWALTANIRLRWEYRPGSELFVVYNEERDTRTARFPELANRAVIIKINRLFRL